MKKITTIYVSGIILVAALLPKSTEAQMSQSPEQPKTIHTAANTQYNKASKFKRIMLGEHYRKEWGTAVDIEILDMETVAGGLTPVKVGGGLQTKSLRLKGADGKEYVLRSVNKDPSKALVSELRGTFAEDIVQDQISSANPYAPMVVASLAKAAGIFHSTPKMVYVPHSAKLGEYESTFAGTVCLLEERPEGNQENNPAYGYSKKIVNSQKLLENVFAHSNHQVNEKEFLKARLFDILIGDWDRHEDQWQWAAFEKNDKLLYHPIPRDRDQAFSKMDGIIPTAATRKWAIRKVQNFDEQIRDVAGLNSNGMHLDRNFTTRLTLADWIEVADGLQNAITNDVITSAFLQMPDAIYNIDGKKTVAILKQRRDDLHRYAVTYYNFLSQQINVTGTKAKEIFEVSRISDEETKVTVYAVNKKDQQGELIFKRTFYRSETKEIRLYGLDGNDIFTIDGETKKGILVRVIGGKGEDTITDQSIVKQAGNQTKIYDNKENKIVGGKDTREYISSDSLKNGYNRRSFAFDWLAPSINPGYNADDGLFLGGGITFKKQQFGKPSFGYMQTLAGNYAFSTGAYSIWYKGIFREVVAKSDLHITAKYNSPTYTRNYYGLGNETENLEDADKNFYRVRISELSFASSLHRQFGKNHFVSVGTGFQSIRVEENDNRFITTGETKMDSSVFGRNKFGRFELGYQFNTVDNPLYPRKGVKLQTNAAYIQNIDESSKNFVQLTTEASFYNSKGRFTLATRTGVSTNFGDDYEFYQANYLGGLTNLRGYRRDRYAGKTSVYSNTELRFSVSNFNAYITKGTWGLLAFADHGRVWTPGEDSDTWHHGYGGGVWFLPFNKLAMTATYGGSKEDKLVSITAGFLF